MNICERFGANLRMAREKAGITQEELSRRCNLSLTTVSRIERGLRSPELGMIIKLADVLATTPTTLCEGIRWREHMLPPRFEVEPNKLTKSVD